MSTRLRPLARGEFNEEICGVIVRADPEGMAAIAHVDHRAVVAAWEKIGVFDAASGAFVGAYLFDGQGDAHIVVLEAWRGRWAIATTTAAFLELAFAERDRFEVWIKPALTATLGLCRLLEAEPLGERDDLIGYAFDATRWRAGAIRARLLARRAREAARGA